MGMPAAQTITTIEALLVLPEDGLRHELLDGKHVVTPAPTFPHQFVHGRLWWYLRTAVGDRVDISVLSSPADIHLGPRTLVQPDLFVVKAPDGELMNVAWKDVAVPLLAAEILSPATAIRDRGTKRRLYLEAGIEEYWIVDIAARMIERWRPGDDRPEMIDGKLQWRLGVGLEGVVDVPDLFRVSRA